MGLSEHVVPHGAPEISTSSSLEVRTSFLVNQLPAKLRHVRRDVNLGIDFVGQGWATGSPWDQQGQELLGPLAALRAMEQWENGAASRPRMDGQTSRNIWNRNSEQFFGLKC